MPSYPSPLGARWHSTLKNMSSRISFAFLIASGWFMACHSDAPKTKSLNEADLIGHWEISKAWRNGKQTETLTGTYYEFDEAGSMKTNLTPTTMEQTYEYSFSGNEINQKGETEITYKVDSLTPSFLAMSMTIQNFPFVLELKKVEMPATLEASDPSASDTLKEL